MPQVSKLRHANPAEIQNHFKELAAEQGVPGAFPPDFPQYRKASELLMQELVLLAVYQNLGKDTFEERMKANLEGLQKLYDEMAETEDATRSRMHLPSLMPKPDR